MAEPSPVTTPKRKRDQQSPHTPSKRSPLRQKAEAAEDEAACNSPRSYVAFKLKGLALDGAAEAIVGAAEKFEDVKATETNLAAWKRCKLETSSDPSSAATSSSAPSEEFLRKDAGAGQADDPLPSNEVEDRTLDSRLPVVDERPQRNPAGRKRAGTPPLRLKKSPAKTKGSDEGQDEIVADPIRAALTWHEDEITIYDPDDEDDDGTGINGVGFKPTPALEHVRIMKRRQQMADYRRREESEARARRSQRRRGELSTIPTGVSKSKALPRRVRFSDLENQKLAVSTV